MYFTIDSIRFQNASQHFAGFKTIAEMGVEVDTRPTFDEDDTIRNAVDEQSDIMDGYYFVSVFREVDNWDNRVYHYTVSLESVYDYFYGFVPREEKPVFLEYYSRLEDTVNSDFVDYFLRLDRQIEESRSDTGHNYSTKYLGESTDFKTEISINSVDDFQITAQSRLLSDESVHYQLIIKTSAGRPVINGIIRPHMRYYVDTGKIKKEYPSLHFVGCNEHFRGLYELEQYTVKEAKKYFEEKELISRFSAEDLARLREGILHSCLGEELE